jgi:hypothetical protein
MAGDEAESNIYRERADDFALHTHQRNREELIRFYQELAQMGKEKIPAEMKSSEESSTAISESENAMNDSIKALSKTATSLSEDGIATAVARMCIAMFLIERIKKLREIALKTEDLGTYSLYLTLRNRVCETVAPNYYSLGSQEVLGLWLDAEPLLFACSNLCGLNVPDLDDVMEEYQPRLAKAVGKS